MMMHLATSQTTQADICFKIYKENKFSITFHSFCHILKIKNKPENFLS